MQGRIINGCFYTPQTGAVELTQESKERAIEGAQVEVTFVANDYSTYLGDHQDEFYSYKGTLKAAIIRFLS